ncbi:MAG: alpha/beta hydrolase [Proteobacteria bacterium]|nr:alpha/beta hydrolase [Pseudomonadota bacterium]
MVVKILQKETFVYKIAGNCRISADVFKPTGSKIPSPVILWIHGGSFISGSRGKFVSTRVNHLQGFLRDGYIVVSIDYRLAPETSLPAICQDAVDACDWVRDEGLEREGASRHARNDPVEPRTSITSRLEVDLGGTMEGLPDRRQRRRTGASGIGDADASSAAPGGCPRTIGSPPGDIHTSSDRGRTFGG